MPNLEHLTISLKLGTSYLDGRSCPRGAADIVRIFLAPAFSTIRSLNILLEWPVEQRNPGQSATTGVPSDWQSLFGTTGIFHREYDGWDKIDRLLSDESLFKNLNRVNVCVPSTENLLSQDIVEETEAILRRTAHRVETFTVNAHPHSRAS